MSLLREETRAHHARCEETSFASALRDGRVTLTEYATQLASAHAVQCVVDLVAFHPSDQVACVAAHWTRRSEALASDLAHLRRERGVEPIRTAELLVAEASVRGVVEQAFARPSALLGVLYVFEGSALGNAFLLPRLREALDLERTMCSYYAGVGRGPAATFAAFGARMDAVALSEEDRSAALAGAIALFDRIPAWLEAIGQACAGGEPPRSSVTARTLELEQADVRLRR